MKKTLTGLLLAFPFLCIAQANYKPAYRVTNEGDTVRGFIDYKERKITPSSFMFKPNQEAVAKEYNLSNTAAYGIDDAEQFRRHQVKISMSREDMDGLSYGLDSSSRTDTVFMNLLFKGKQVSLYSYQDVIKKRFYIQRNGASPVELQRHVFMSLDSRSTSVTNSRFRNQLQAIDAELHPSAPVRDQKWANLKYVDSYLIKAVASLNDEEVVQSKHRASQPFIGTGINVAKASYSGTSNLNGDDATAKTSLLPFMTFGIDFYANPAVKRLVYRLELSLLAGKYEVNSTEYKSSSLLTEVSDRTHTFDQYTLQFSPQVVYNIYNAENTQFYISGGVGLNASKYGKSVLTEKHSNSFYGESTKVTADPIDFMGFNYDLQLGAGLILNKRTEISLAYSFPATVTDYLYYSIDVQRISVGLSYRFGKK